MFWSRLFENVFGDEMFPAVCEAKVYEQNCEDKPTSIIGEKGKLDGVANKSLWYRIAGIGR
jgi:hypothetical protein